VPTKASGTSRAKEARHGTEVKLKLSCSKRHAGGRRGVVGFPYFGGIASRTSRPMRRTATSVFARCRCSASRWARKAHREAYWWPRCSTCRPRSTASTVAWAGGAKSYDDDAPYTPAWQERITGVPRDQIITVARQFADNADKTHGKSMVIIGAAMNHWYHSDMNYRGVINMLMMCGCIGQSGGGWAHYVGQEKLRPQTGWTALAFALDWIRPPRQMNSTSFFYAHTDQWRYEKLGMDEMLSPLADKKMYAGSMIDYNVRAERMGWLPARRSSDQSDAGGARRAPRRHGPEGLRRQGAEGRLAEDELRPTPTHRRTGRATCSSGAPTCWAPRARATSTSQAPAGHQNGVQGKDLGADGQAVAEVKWHKAPEGKLDLLVTLDFRMSTTCLYSTSCCPRPPGTRRTTSTPATCTPSSTRCRGGGPGVASRSDWEIYKGFAKKFSEVCVGHLGVERRWC
jgi:nitrate reductase alpha subunit